MIKAEDARKVSAEAEQAIWEKKTLEEKRKLDKLFEKRMSDVDRAVKAATKLGEWQTELSWPEEEVPVSVKESVLLKLKEAGFTVKAYPGDGDRVAININWRNE